MTTIRGSDILPLLSKIKMTEFLETLGSWLCLLLCTLGLIGWCMNTYQIIQSINNGITTKLIVKLVGVFAAPLGAVLGWIG